MKLNESGAPKTVFHYTNINNLFSILEEKKLRAQWYPNKTVKARKSKDKSNSPDEIATIRPSAIHNQSLSKLSSNIGAVRFIIEAEKINDVSIKPIAEYPIGDVRSIRDNLSDSFYEEYYMANLEDAKKRKVKKAANHIAKNAKIFCRSSTYREYLKKEFPKAEGSVINDVMLGTSLSIKNLADWTSGRREGEERIVMRKKKRGISLDPKYMKIEILEKKIKDNYNDTDLGYKPVSKALEILDKNDNMFIKNKGYAMLRNLIKDEMKEENYL